MMKALRFRVQNFRNINDSGWIPLEQVTAFVGRNESGKTTLLKAFHKFNPATPEPYDPQKEFPRDRYTRDYVANDSKGGDWPVCSVAFAIPDNLNDKISEVLELGQQPPIEAILIRYYDGSLSIDYSPSIEDNLVAPEPVLAALNEFASSARRLLAPAQDQEEATAAQRKVMAEWATSWQDRLKTNHDLRNENGVKLLTSLRSETEGKSNPQTADMVEALLEAITSVRDVVVKGSVVSRINDLVKENIPVLIYFDNYGILESAIWLPRFLEDLKQKPTDTHIRTVSAMFKHVGLDPKEITKLGQQNSQPTPENFAADQRYKEERAIRLNSASNDISLRFSEWWSQRRHKIRYHADGDYFRIWITDDKRPDVEIELEARSKGFQWFFSFYLLSILRTVFSGF